MSKKKKNFKAQLNQIAQQMQKENSPKKIIQSKSDTGKQQVKAAKQSKMQIDKNNSKEVKKEITKIIVAMIICIVILVLIWLLNIKTNYINEFSDWLVKILHIRQ